MSLNEKSLRCIQLMLISLFASMNMAYFLCYYNVTLFDRGSVFVMGAVLGLAETTSTAISGYLMIKTNSRFTYHLYAVTASVFYLKLYYGREFLLSGSGIFGVIVLYISMSGVGGAYNTLFIIIEEVMPPDWLGQTISICLATCQLTASLCPQIALLKMPIPILMTVGFLVYSQYGVYYIS